MRSIREVADMLGQLTQDERALVEMFVERITKGRIAYGPWVEEDDSREFKQEALEEILDHSAYLCMQTYRLSAIKREARAELYADADEFQPKLAEGTGTIERPEKTWPDLIERCKRGGL